MHTAGFSPTGAVDVAAIVVTYDSARHIDELIGSLRDQVGVRMRVIVVDNASRDDTVARVRRHADVVCLDSGGNLGYAAGVNIGMSAAGDARAVFVVNPDAVVRPGAVRTLLDALDADAGLGLAAPRLEDATGRTTISLFHEPTPGRALADALLGPVWQARPPACTEWERRAAAYDRAHDVDWASGAALMVRAAAARSVGEWDEGFFLYSEETDFCRRLRDQGWRIGYVPDARVRHDQGGSGSSPDLDALMAVNRVRYLQRHAPGRAALYRRIARLGALLRGRNPVQRHVAAVLRDPAGWAQLPAATWHPAAPGPVATASDAAAHDTAAAAAHDTGSATADDTAAAHDTSSSDGLAASAAPGHDTAAPGSRPGPVASVIVPAHDEADVVGTGLAALAGAVAHGALEVHVVCNGCTDATADAARAVPGVIVHELAQASKTAALNAGDAAAVAWPRIYLDADVVLPAAAVPALVRALNRPGVHAGRPRFEYDTTSSTSLVRAYHRARMRVPALSQALWGAGVYAVTAHGHARIAPFPPVIADDVHVDRAFAPGEKAIVATAPVRVSAPRTPAALLAVLARARRGPSQQGVDTGRATLSALLRTVRGPVSGWDAAVYAAFTLLARRRARRTAGTVWERDDTTRIAR
ncbi:glycosyltransferase family 2 protein [Microbacterium luticocti]|uniref:glycosyltransferase family 2 protein n=1 Tax=Microbacterium luticocti TaxID=451764 RepID=UPI00041A9314|nr:glycosyltransferase family 2 protein [Microbacterium luticocti]